MHHASRKSLAATLASGLIGNVALADAPLVSETADVIPADACQVEAAATRARTSGQAATTSQDVLGSCGVWGRHQIGLGYTRERSDVVSAHALRTFVKTTLKAPEEGRFGYGLRLGVEASRAPGMAWHAAGLEVLGVMTREVAPSVLFHANLGHAWDRTQRQGTTPWSLGVETTTDITVAADVFGDDRKRPWVSAGIGSRLGRGYSINASVAVQFDSPRQIQWTLGAKIEF
jgi:hypothetical protein